MVALPRGRARVLRDAAELPPRRHALREPLLRRAAAGRGRPRPALRRRADGRHGGGGGVRLRRGREDGRAGAALGRGARRGAPYFVH